MRTRLLRAVRLPVCFLLLLPGLVLAQALRFTTIDIGQGDSSVLVTPGGCVALFDGGPTGSGTAIKAYLQSIGVTRIDMVFNSHFHADHLGGLDEVEQGTNAVPITAVYDRGGSYSSTAFTEYANQFAGRRHSVTVGQTWSLCNEVTLRVVAVNGNGVNTSNENSYSVTVKISYGNFDALVGGDLVGVSPDDVESVIAANVGPIELYKVHHHGSKYSSNDTFLNATMPTVSFISVGLNNTYGHPTPECLGRLAAHGSDVWQTEDPATNTARGNIKLTTATGSSFTVDQGSNSVTYNSKEGGTDTQPPTAPGALAANAVSSSEIDLSWAASTDNVGVTEYRVYRSTNGNSFSLAGTSATTGFADVGLAAGTTYWYRVTARDAAGNESADSNTASATTNSGTTALAATAPNGGESWTGGGVYNITWTASGIANVKLEYSLNDGGSWTVIASSVAASAGSYAWTVPSSASTQARVRVSDAQSGTPSDLSDNPFTIVVAGPAKVILNEILANEPGSATAGELIELVNVGGSSIDISGWTLSDASAVQHTFTSGTVLGAGKAIVVFGGASGIPPGLNNAVAASTGSLSLNNGGDTVKLKNGKQVMDSYTYSSSLASQDGVSMNRSPDASDAGVFVLHNTIAPSNSSPGKRTSGAAF